MIGLFKTARSLIVAFLVGTLLLYGTTSLATIPDTRTLRYSVIERNMTIGELEVIIEREDGRIKATVITHLQGLAKLLAEEFIAETWFRVDDGHAILEKGLRRTGRDDTGSGFTVDYDNKMLKLDSGDSYSFRRGEILDSTGFPVALITADIASMAGKIVWEVNAHKARRYVYHTPQPEILELDGRRYNTWKVTRNKLEDIHRTVTFWLDVDRQNIPLKIITIKKDRATVLTLLHTSGSAASSQ